MGFQRIIQRRSWVAGLALVCLTGGATVPADPPVLIGRVSDFETDRPLGSTTVGLWRNGGAVGDPVRLDDLGFFRIDPPDEGLYRLVVETEGYRPVVFDTVRVNNDVTVEVMLKVTVSEQLEGRWWHVARFDHGKCETWQENQPVISRRTGRAVMEFRWRLCNHSLREYKIEMQLANKLPEPVEVEYRLSTRPEYCQSTQPRTALGDRVKGILKLRANQRSRHRGRPGIIPKIGFGYQVNFCAFSIQN